MEDSVTAPIKEQLPINIDLEKDSLEIPTKMNRKAAIIVAHPDDEFIFAFNLRLAHQNVDWHVYCATYSKNSSRGREFIQAVRVLDNSRPYLLGLKDLPYDHLQFTDENGRKEFDIDWNSFDDVFTHNPIGEYFHPHHIDVHNWVIEELTNCEKQVNLWVFAQNYSYPTITFSEIEKVNSPCLEIYEREAYILYNFDLINEGFVNYAATEESVKYYSNPS